ncbi:MAG TPA: HD domain-containing protein [Atribacteraceae bacterium]|nr:HD domain-containing protein [Atribacteraceae bacterium]
MVTAGLIKKIFQGASMHRWNDQIRPIEFTEMDKQAHKMVIAWLLGRIEEEISGSNIQWEAVIEGGFFEYLERLVLTDIKPPVFHRLVERVEIRKKLNEFVLSKLSPEIGGLTGDFFERFRAYLAGEDLAVERRIIRAAHYFATHWEFQIIYNYSPRLYGLEETREAIERELVRHYELECVREMVKYRNFIDLCGQLRFQRRWGQSERIPRTSVLGHMLVVALLSYLFCRNFSPCPKRLYNDFFAGLFHDLPEVLTRDIISPVKRAVDELDAVLKEYERSQLDEKILPQLPTYCRQEIVYFTRAEFENKVVLEGVERTEEDRPDISRRGVIAREFNRDEYRPLDGRLLKICDDLSAFVEATLSIDYGISSEQLLEGREHLYRKYRDSLVGNFPLKPVLDSLMGLNVKPVNER